MLPSQTPVHRAQSRTFRSPHIRLLPSVLHRTMAVCARMPVLAIPHGGGPCFQLPDGSIGPPGFWLMMGSYLKKISKSLPAKPKAMLMCVARAPAK